MFEPTHLPGLLVHRPRQHRDNRGGFARLWSEESFAASGATFQPAHISVSSNIVAGTLRGLHWQAAPFGETKLVRVARGRVFDVAVDMRPNSATRFRHFGIELDADSQTGLLIPAGFAHGFITLLDRTDVLYCIDGPYTPDAALGARYDDPALNIAWPHAPSVVAERDLAWPPL
jgi:dTDP-4-dehydrorhamnose 3,5-epimerase